MTPDQIEAIVERVLSQGVPIQGSLYFLVLGAAAAASTLGAYLASYLGEKGKRFATHQDLARIVQSQERTTRAVEEVKAQVSGRQWLHQQVWNERKALLASLLNELAAVGTASERMKNALPLMKDGVPKAAKEEAGTTFRESDAQVRASLAKIRQLAALAELMLGTDSRQELERFLARLDGLAASDFAQLLEGRAQAARETFEHMAVIGRRELGISPAS